MSSHRLRLSISKADMERLTTNDFVWRSPPTPSSFRTNVSPDLAEIHGINRRNVEFVRLATLAYMVDRTSARPSRGWTRQLSLEVPVWDAEPWNAVSAEFVQLLNFLTNDSWSLEFYRARTPRSNRQDTELSYGTFSLLSGGADSLCGAVRLLDRLDDSCFVSHSDSSRVGHAQNVVIGGLESLRDPPVSRWSCWLGRSEKQLGTEAVFPQEPTSRSRSLLFIALGLAAAASSDAPLWVPENAYASLNPPLAAERSGALSTRTTHPWYLWRLGELLKRVGAHSKILNPFWGMTKGEMFAEVSTTLGQNEASNLLSASDSCSRSNIRYAGVSGSTQCGICFGCLIRRAAFHASGLEDQTPYLIDDVNSPIGAAGGWLTPGYRVDLEAVRYAAARGFDVASVLSTHLPPNVTPGEAVDVAQRGHAELVALVS